MTTARIQFTREVDQNDQVWRSSLRFMAQALYHQCGVTDPIHMDVEERRFTIAWEPEVPMQKQGIVEGVRVDRQGGFSG